MYRWSIERKIKYYQRKGLTYEQQLEIARKRGGDKVNVAVILMFVVLIMIYATIYIIFEGSNKTDIISQSKQDSNNEEINNISYNDDKFNINNKYSSINYKQYIW